MLNHVHLHDEAARGEDEPQERYDERLMEVAHQLAAAWAASLGAAFPGRPFAVEVATPEEDYGPTVYALSDPDE